ncbi:hypothetical protein [Poriferisphaera sp. WC338]|uniref:hypothetical protein n=1 Tax=Poriferisphaera sp. WC338 TaxID=3425129 RepID=UPI003D81A271
MPTRTFFPILSMVIVLCGLTATLSAKDKPATTQPAEKRVFSSHPTTDDGTRYILSPEQAALPAYHTSHEEYFAKDVLGYNHFVLRGIDVVQASAPDGGGYFIGIKAKPTESPIGYNLSVFGKQLLKAPRTTSYCSGSSYSAFIEGINHYSKDQNNGKYPKIKPRILEALRMQEPDGGRRNDGVKMWGHWNDDGFGNHFALVQYTRIGKVIDPMHARPGDFMNISWTNGGGHSVIFLGYVIEQPENPNDVPIKKLRYWSSQGSTNGLADQTVSLSRIRAVKVVRIVRPQNLFNFNIKQKVQRKISGDKIIWPDDQ